MDDERVEGLEDEAVEQVALGDDIDRNEVLEDEAVEQVALGEVDAVDEVSEITDKGTVNALVKQRSIPAFFRIDPRYNKRWFLSILAALIGLALGTIPPILALRVISLSREYFNIIFPIFFPIFFIATPLLIYFFSSVLRCGRDIRTFIVTTVFSLFSIYLNFLAFLSTFVVIANSLSLFRIPSFIAEFFGMEGLLPDIFSSDFVYPFVFTLLGIFITAILYRSPPRKRKAKDRAIDASLEEKDDLNAE